MCLTVCLCVYGDRADQGRLLDYVVSWGNLNEEKVAFYLRDILEALHYLHNCRIAHLDVKVSLSSSGNNTFSVFNVFVLVIRSRLSHDENADFKWGCCKIASIIGQMTDCKYFCSFSLTESHI